jgi:superfamily I DNA/RNA helicase
LLNKLREVEMAKKELSFTPTEEQTAIKEAFPDHRFLTIQAKSGSGKTSTLYLLANSTEDRILYLAFNKSMAEEARRKMPLNVECRTLHSICYQFLDHRLRAKLSRPEGQYVNVAGTGSEIAKKFKINNLIDKRGKTLLTRAMIGLMIKQTVGKFEFSDDPFISRKHFPSVHLADIKRKGINEHKLITEVVKYAKQLWRERIDPNTDTLMTHDTYVKLFELSGADLGYDIIFGDEFQDVNPAFLSILRNAKSAKQVVVVGDEYQSIYQFRGSQNMMKETSTYGAELPLTACFRFGPKVANIANMILSDKEPLRHPLVGKGFDTVVGSYKSDVVDYTKPYTIIFRKNLTLLMEAMDRIADGEEIIINVDTRDFISMVDSVNALRRGDIEKVKHETVLPYADWDEFVECAEADPDAKRLLNIVVSGKANTIAHTLRTHRNSPTAKVTLTTAHKSKGLEWDQVIVANDFPSNYDKKTGEWVGLEEAERNLLYVAHTRCVKCLQWNTTVQEIIDINRVATEKVPTSTTLPINGIKLGVFGAGTSRKTVEKFVADSFDGNYNHAQAYESWLEEGEGDFLGEINLLPEINKLVN